MEEAKARRKTAPRAEAVEAKKKLKERVVKVETTVSYDPAVLDDALFLRELGD